ncbi:IS1380 family transposase [Kocuria varians]|uniref:Transposase DDE domain-containing protein n=1 Tax=Kocuria varians TaxID=1272 RepID=A0A7D7L1I3_KOCVA|nr:IS1380 family transposase [Kocuria varians]QMS57675.1 hypothetical protein CIB50_0002423 [Kocuria varians]
MLVVYATQNPQKKDTSQVQSSHVLTPVFDEPNLASHTGLTLIDKIATSTGLYTRLKTLTVGANPVPKFRTIITGMLTGADSIDDLHLIRTTGHQRILGAVRAPSTVGSFLRAFTHGHVMGLHAAFTSLVQAVLGQVPGLLGEGTVYLDLDDTVKETHGYQKQGAAYGYNKIKGLNALLAVISTDTSSPIPVAGTLRRGNVRSGQGCGWLTSRVLPWISRTLGDRDVLVRADAAFYRHELLAACLRHGARFSITIPQWKNVQAAISRIPEGDWIPIVYPHAVPDPDTGELISDAAVAEIPFTAFVSHRKNEHIRCRLIVRRVKRLSDAPEGQGGLFQVYRYHAFVTNSDLNTIDADRVHRKHAIVEQVISEVKSGPLRHLPSGRQHANAAWLVCALIAFVISRVIAVTAGMPVARMSTVIRKIIAVPSRLASRSRRVVVHLPRGWPWADSWLRVWRFATTPPG